MTYDTATDKSNTGVPNDSNNDVRVTGKPSCKGALVNVMSYTSVCCAMTSQNVCVRKGSIGAAIITKHKGRAIFFIFPFMKI